MKEEKKVVDIEEVKEVETETVEETKPRKRDKVLKVLKVGGLLLLGAVAGGLAVGLSGDDDSVEYLPDNGDDTNDYIDATVNEETSTEE